MFLAALSLSAVAAVVVMLRDSIRHDRERRTRAARRLNLEGTL